MRMGKWVHRARALWKVKEGCSEEGTAELGPEGLGEDEKRTGNLLPWVVYFLPTRLYAHMHFAVCLHLDSNLPIL